MARKQGFMAAMAQAQREAERRSAAQQRASASAQRARERAVRDRQRAQVADERERKRLHLEARASEVDAMNAELAEAVEGIEGILATGVASTEFVDFFENLKQHPTLPPFDAGDDALPLPPLDWGSYAPVAPTGLRKAFGKAAHVRALEEAKATFDLAQADHARLEAARQERITRRRAEYDEGAAKIHAAAEKVNDQVDQFHARFDAGEPEAVRDYFSLVLESSYYPSSSYPSDVAVAYVPDSHQLVVEKELPTSSIVPAVKVYRFVKTRDEVTSTARPMKDVRALYSSALTQITLRTILEVFEADPTGKVESLVLNGRVSTIDPATGQPIRPTLVTVRTTREVFSAINLRDIDPVACLQHLGAAVSKSPAELAPVRPVLELNMVDPRFVDEQDVLTGLDDRPNLMELTPSEFESLITNLFSKMGLDTKLTQASRDGGVDCVAYDPRPIFGGKVVIQAKRYKNTVGVSAVRDLFGTVQNEGASKGILVATSGYGNASYEFANNKPLELLDGANLLYLLEEHAGITAKIVPPDDWTDPVPDF